MRPGIVFLGTGGDSIIVGKQVLGSGGIVIQSNELQFVIDPGPGCLVRAAQYGVNLRETTAILVSHAHSGHANDVNAVIGAMTYGGLDKKGVIIASKSVIQGVGEDSPVLSNYGRKCVEKVICLEKGQRAGVEDFEIIATTALHSDPTTVGFKIIGSRFSLAYTGDTRYSEQVVDGCSDVDILIANTVYPAKAESDVLGIDDCIKLVRKTKPKLVIITHFGIKMIRSDLLNQARILQKETGIQTITAKDGMMVDPLSYAASLKQRTLMMYK